MGTAAGKILNAYDKAKGVNSDFCLSVAGLIRGFLVDDGIRFVDVTCRVKERDSLAAKIRRKGLGRYKSISDITDVCGVRVITYLEGDVRRVCEILEREFSVDVENSIDKSKPVDADRFGYRSVHYVVGHHKNRSKLREYQRFLDCKAEIQVRSILQHAWAEIEHDMGYKTAEEVPAPVKRRFSRLAGLLELADEEFMTIRRELGNYEAFLAENLVSHQDDVSIDAESLVAFVNVDPVVKRIDMAIAKCVNSGLDDSSVSDVASYSSQIRYVGVSTIGDLKRFLVKFEGAIVRFADDWLHEVLNWKGSDNEFGNFSRGVSVFYLAYLMLLRDEDDSKITGFVDHYFNKSVDLTNRLRSVYNAMPEDFKV
ncbi:GTP pyrophosphokinase [Burkholderia gladioli]|uniref:GTP pyrophosphokinase n=1 Tax=Burkholderia gladioli TaxID=28095 RepID=UPI00163FF700|nr:hypothetical protein [Burkholderia gladioli]